MANIKEAIDILMELEFGNIKKSLHKNSTETGYTYKGIYQTAWPDWIGWNFVLDGLSQNNNNLEETSLYLEQGDYLQNEVQNFYKKNFWNIAKLDDVHSQEIANEIFIFGVNVGMKNAIKKTQKLLGVTVDGVIGNVTLGKLNKVDISKFDFEFDELEKEYYNDIIKKKPYLSIYRKGWYNRAERV